jgi:hypothetical protein
MFDIYWTSRAEEKSLPGNRSPNELPLLRPVPFPTDSSVLFRLGPTLEYPPNAACLWEEEDEEYGLDGWKEALVGLAEVGGVGYDETEGVFELLVNAGPLEVEGAWLKWLPGPVS